MTELTDKELTQKERHLLAFALFNSAMRIGPDVFQTITSIAIKTGVLSNYLDACRSWTDFAQSFHAANEQGKTPSDE